MGDIIIIPKMAPKKLDPGLQVGGRLLIANHLDQSNHLPNQKQVQVRLHCVLIRLFQSSSWALKVVLIFRVPAVFQWTTSFAEPHLRFPKHDHILLSIGGDALRT
jgi:hypothetical protein